MKTIAPELENKNIEVIEDQQLDYWALKLHVGKKELAEAIKKFGNDPETIRKHFIKKRS